MPSLKKLQANKDSSMLPRLLPSLWSKTACMLQCTWASSGECGKACTGGEKSIESIGVLPIAAGIASAETQSAASTTVCAIILLRRAKEVCLRGTIPSTTVGIIR